MAHDTEAQGGIIPVNLSTRLTRNLKTSHEIFVRSPVLCRENKLWAKYHKNKVIVTRMKFLLQEMNKCHRNKFPEKIEYMPNKEFNLLTRRNSCHKKKVLVTRYKFLSQEKIPVTQKIPVTGNKLLSQEINSCQKK